MNPRCKICIDPKCDGRMDCNCSTCKKTSECYRVILPTVRITRKCTQSCAHCCFSCSPKAAGHMTVEIAETIARFFKANDIFYANVMGGEFWMCKDWVAVLEALIGPLGTVRVVTNGDWAKGKKTSRAVIDFFQAHPVCYMAITRDTWHTNTYVDQAAAACLEAGIDHRIQCEDDKEGVVPAGRGEWECGFWGTFGCYCHRPDHMYTPLIDEDGRVYRCGFGVWDYTNVGNHLEGNFHMAFKEFGLKFNSVFIGSCRNCVRAFETTKRTD
jgi:hypothetical protein